MFKKNEKILVLDTETANGLDCPLIYDLGFSVVDIDTGEVFQEGSYIIREIFFNKHLMNSAYYAEKKPQYIKDIKSGKRIVKYLYEVKSIIYSVIKEYGIKKISAHNAIFDYKACQNTQRYITYSKYRNFFPKNVTFVDTLKLAKATVGKTVAYKEYCKKYGYVCSNGRVRLTAEILYKYLTGNNDFVESHTGLEDVHIESKILVICHKLNKEINGFLWERKNKSRTIYFDMDGTIADFYGVNNWLDYLKKEDVTPYKIANSLFDSAILERALIKAKENNKIGIISWCSKNGSDSFNREVTKVKKEWLRKNFPSVIFDEIIIVKYGTPKSIFKRDNDILFDDELQNRDCWGKFRLQS